MRYVLISLIVLNFGYLGWHWLLADNQPEVVVTEAPRTQGQPIVLLRELGPNGRREADMAAAVSNPLRLAGTDNERCLAVGPFSDVFGGQDALEQLRALDQQMELKAVDVATGERDYRVLIPPATSAEEAFRKLRELQASQIDSYVITQGQQAMGISLGVFSTIEAAEQLQGKLEAMGYSSEIIEIERLSRTYWLFLAQNATFQAQEWLSKQSELELKRMNCIDAQ